MTYSPSPASGAFHEYFEKTPMVQFLAAWMNYIMMAVFGQFREILRSLNIEQIPWKQETHSAVSTTNIFLNVELESVLEFITGDHGALM